MPINVALNKSASQSSLSAWSEPGEAVRAINGKKTGGFSFHTDLEDNPWWQVDLWRVFFLTSIIVYNRGDAGTDFAERAKGMIVRISADGANWEKIHSDGGCFGGARDKKPFVVFCFGKMARFVHLQLPGRTYFHLDEVEVYAEDIPYLSSPLIALGSKYGTDKVSHGFCDIYESVFSPMRLRVTKVLEIGVFFGASLRMWRDWFPHAIIHGADHFTGHQGNGSVFANSDSFLREVEMGTHPRIMLHTLDQSKREDVEKFSTQFRHGTFDLVIDDASHLMRDQQLTLAGLFCLVKPGGYFVIEDIHSSSSGGYDVEEDGANSTLLMVERAIAGQGWQSKYMTKEEADFLDATVDLSQSRVYSSGVSQTCVLRRRASSEVATFPVVIPGSVAVIDYASADGYNQSLQQAHITWVQDWIRQSGIPADIACFGPDALDGDFTEKNYGILSAKKGGGYWLWKPYIIASMLAATNAEFLIYCDSGSIINVNLAETIGALRSTEAAMLVFSMSSTPDVPRIECTWTKGQVLRALDAMDPAIARSNQIGATASVWKVCDASRKFAADWLRLMQEPIFATDLPSSDGEEDPIFAEHRHDQSIFSILAKKMLSDNDKSPPMIARGDYDIWVGHRMVARFVRGAHLLNRQEG